MKNEQISAWRALMYIFRAAPGSFALMAVMGLVNGGASIAAVWATEGIFAKITGGYGQELARYLAGYFAALTASAAYSVWYMRYHVQFFAIIDFEERIRRMLHGKSRRISNEVLETPDAYAFIRQADGCRQSLFRYGQIYVEAVMTVVQAVMAAAYISSFHVMFLLFLPLAAAPTLVEMLYDSRLWRRGYETATRCRREEAEYERAVTDETACKESRITGACGLLIEKWRRSREERDAVEEGRSGRMFAVRLALAAPECAGSAGGLAVSALLLYFGKIGLPAFTAGVAAYSSITSILGGLSGTLGNERQYRGMIQPYFRYWSMPEREQVRPGEDRCGFEREITLTNVSFTYPNQVSPAVRDVCLTVKKGEILAVVGENGAGKSTLVNLILGLYRPTSGRVCYDGVDVLSVGEAELHMGQSALPQGFCRYKMTAGDNIAIGDFAKGDGGEVRRRLGRIFPGGEIGEDTMLGREFGGRELSGGQWQQLSCARGFYKDGGLMVLDEPTSAIDPLREKALYDEFFRELSGRTGIIVTHRLGAAQMADRIVVMRQGRIAELGTQRELLEAGGLYAELWRSQVEAFGE